MNEGFKADPEKYARLCTPHPSPEKADAAAVDFIRRVGELREEFGIPELVIHFELQVQADEGVQTMTAGCGWGNQLRQAKLAKRAADREFADLVRLIEPAAAALPELWRALVTDPTAKREG